jgi:hypothetical protein
LRKLDRVKNIIFGAYKNWCEQKKFFGLREIFEARFLLNRWMNLYENWLKNKYFGEFSKFI